MVVLGGGGLLLMSEVPLNCSAVCVVQGKTSRSSVKIGSAVNVAKPQTPHVHGEGCRVQGAGCRVQGAGCRVQGVWGGG